MGDTNAAYAVAMSPFEPASAVVVRVALPARLARLRARSDWAAGVGVPAHVTVLYPFVPAAGLVPAVRLALVTIARTLDPFDVRFERVGRFPAVVYLAPEPAAPFIALTEAVQARFPGFPPYGGAFDEVVPHLTITEPNDVVVDEAALDAIATEAAEVLPLRARVSGLEVLVESDDRRWRSRWRIPMGRHTL
jgi:2'-5' RNA ligase